MAGTIAVVAVLLVVGALASGKLPTRKKMGDERLVTVTALWTPSPLPQGSLVRIHVEVGGLKDDTVRETAPFSQTYTVLKGDRVYIHAAMRNVGGKRWLGCSIAVNGVETVSNYSEIDEPVACEGIA